VKFAIVGSLVLWSLVSAAIAQEMVRSFSWIELKAAGRLTAAEVQPEGTSDPKACLKIENPTGEPKSVNVLDLDSPGVTTFTYAIEGSVRYENVEGTSYLEMWSWFADGRMYFSRTLGDAGPLGHLEGSSDWRPFSLPFYSDRRAGTPTRLVVNVVFAGPGTVYLTPLKLIQYSVGWWTKRTADWLITVGLLVGGLCGGLIGILGGTGKARGFVLALNTTLAGVGVAILIVGVIAVLLGQPYDVYFPLLALGIVPAGFCGGILFPLRHHYQQIELQKMAAMDTR
jgi:hypothetical protein